jgi:hypothetical protein
VVLAGHPKLKNDLRRSSMEEIGSRATIFELEGLGSEKPKYLKWLLLQPVVAKTKDDGSGSCVLHALDVVQVLCQRRRRRHNAALHAGCPTMCNVWCGTCLFLLKSVFIAQGRSAVGFFRGCPPPGPRDA